MSIEFELVGVGRSAERTHEVTNLLAEPMTLVIEGTDAAVFSTDTSTVGPFSKVTVKITFRPADVKPYAATLRDDANVFEIELAGEGIVDEVEEDVATRFDLFIPSAETRLVLGDDVYDREGGGASYNGFGLKTEEDVIVDAGAELVLGAGKGAFLHGGTGLFLTGGFGGSGVESVKQASAITGAVFGVLDATIGLAVMARTIGNIAFAGIGDIVAKKWSGKMTASMLGLFGAASAMTAGMLDIATISSDEELGGKGKACLPAATLFGQAGVMIGSPAYTAIYGVAGMVLGSLFPLVVGVESEMFGFKAATVTGWLEATVQSLKKVSLSAGPPLAKLGTVEIEAGKKVEVTARKGEIHLVAGDEEKGTELMMKKRKLYLGLCQQKHPSVFVDKEMAQLRHDKNVSIISDAKLLIRADNKSDPVEIRKGGGKISMKGNRILLG